MNWINDGIALLTPILAVYGAGLSTYLCVKAVRSDRIQVAVTHGWGYSPEALRESKSPEELTISAVNECRREIVMTSLTLEIPGLARIVPAFLEPFGAKKERLKEEPDQTRLMPGDKIEVSFDHSALKTMLRSYRIETPVQVRAVFEDTLENLFFGSWFEIGKGGGSRSGG